MKKYFVRFLNAEGQQKAMINKSLFENFLLIPQKDNYFDFEQKIDSSYIWDILKYKYESDLYFLSMLGIHIK